MLVEQVKKMSPLGRFLYWVTERRQILFRRNMGQPKPWTDDEILQSNYFTNVKREDDRVTKWFKNNIREPLRNDPNVVFATIAFRWFNWPDTGKLLWENGLIENWNAEQAVTLLNRVKANKNKVFTGAYNISNAGSRRPKIEKVCYDNIQPAWDKKDEVYEFIRNDSMAKAFVRLRELPGLGGSGFMAAQVICDLAYTHVLENAPDWWEWCSWGPGSKRGMNILYCFDVDYSMPQQQWQNRLQKLCGRIQQLCGIRLHARDVQNCLCEYSKYIKVLNGGKSKRRYPGR